MEIIGKRGANGTKLGTKTGCGRMNAIRLYLLQRNRM